MSEWIHAVCLLFAPNVHSVFVQFLVQSILLCERPSALGLNLSFDWCSVGRCIIRKAEKTLHSGCASCDDPDGGLDNRDYESDVVSFIGVFGGESIVIYYETADRNSSCSVIEV
jgi:hypothetical protein